MEILMDIVIAIMIPCVIISVLTDIILDVIDNKQYKVDQNIIKKLNIINNICWNCVKVLWFIWLILVILFIAIDL